LESPKRACPAVRLQSEQGWWPSRAVAPREREDRTLNELLPFIVSGIATGSIYGLAGTGLVLTYKTSGIFNFGYGALASVAAYVFYFLHVDHRWDWKISFVVAVFVVGSILGLLMEVFARALANQTTSTKIVGTVGVVLLVQGLATVKYGSDTISVEQYLPKSEDSFKVADVNVSYSQLWVTIIAVVGVLALYALFRFTRSGLSMRAVVDDAELVSMQAISPTRVRRISWLIGSTFAALSGVLLLPFVGLNAITLTLLVVQAFGAAAIGFFANIPLTFLGGIVIAIGADISTKYVLDVSWLTGLPPSLPFLVLFVVLLITPRRRLVPPSSILRRQSLRYKAPGRVRVLTGILVLAVLALVPLLVSNVKLPFFTVGLSQMIILLSLGLLVRTSGQVSLCHSVFAAIGAVTFSQLAVDHHWPWLLALLVGGLIVVPVGAVVAIPAIRLSGLFLALATFGFGILVEQLLYAQSWMFTPLDTGRAMPRPSFAEGDKPYYYVVLAFVVLIAGLIVAIHESRLGRILRGLADAPVAMATLGLSTNVTRVIVFCISAFLAGIGGILYGSSAHFAISSDSNYTSFYSLVLLAVLALAPFGEPWFAVVIGVTAVIPGYITGGHVRDWLNVIFGIFAVQVSMQGGQPEMPARLKAVFERFRPQRVTPPVPKVAQLASLAERLGQDAKRTGLAVDGLGVRFGGLVAVHDLSFAAPLGRITGLIGPNGAGKTTTFDACSGLNRRISGAIKFNGKDITKLPPSARGRLGLGRTFQRMQLGDELTVGHNVALGIEAGQAGRRVWSQLFASTSQRQARRDATMAALDLCGISDLVGKQAGALSTGQRRLVELARCLAGDFDVLLLDEPSSGLDREETAQFDEVLRTIVRERGCGILLVEHDMSLVLNVCDYIYVLDFGRLLFEGDPSAVAQSPEVRAAYLGSESAITAAAAQEELL
jgi:ABC-type branched-subunit amino acid transport system ATPase component/branched-subunit amino acid ABC-type transport system permease component